MRPTLSKEYLSQDILRYARALLIDGYVDLEAPRILGMSSKCGHSRFKNESHPSKHFADFLFNFMENVENAKIPSQYAYSDSINIITQSAGDGICQLCATFLLVKLLKHQKERNSVSFIIKNQKHVRFKGEKSELLMLFSNTGYSCTLSMFCTIIMAHPHICKYAFKYSDFWCNCFATFTCLVSAACQLFDSDPNKDIDAFLIINSLFCFGLQLIRNIYLVNKKQWKWLIKKYQIYHRWISMLKMFLQNDKWLGWKQSESIINTIIILFVYLDYFKELPPVSDPDFDQTINKFYDTLWHKVDGKSIIYLDRELSFVRKNLWLIKAYPDWLYTKINIFSRIVKGKKWNNVKCDNIKCSKNRATTKLYKCKKCQLARYCTKYCQKRNWGTHKLICNDIYMHQSYWLINFH